MFPMDTRNDTEDEVLGRRARKAAFYKYRPAWSMGGDFSSLHGQVFIYDRHRHQRLDGFESASAQAEKQGVGIDHRLICLLLPIVSAGSSQIRISFYDRPPVIKEEDWQGIYVFDLWVPSRQLIIETERRRIFTLHERGSFAARWQYADDYHQLQLWRRQLRHKLLAKKLRPRQIR